MIQDYITEELHTIGLEGWKFTRVRREQGLGVKYTIEFENPVQYINGMPLG